MAKMKKKSIKKKATKRKAVKKKVSRKRPIKSKKAAKAKIKKKPAKIKTVKTKKIRQKTKTALKTGRGDFKEIEKMLLSQRAELLKLISKSVAWERDISKLERGDTQDMAATSLEREMTFAMGSREREEFLMINNALKKIAARTYGRCESCEEKINIKRLKIVPFAQYCMECKSIMEREIEPESEETFS